jgi:hypothetical protein
MKDVKDRFHRYGWLEIDMSSFYGGETSLIGSFKMKAPIEEAPYLNASFTIEECEVAPGAAVDDHSLVESGASQLAPSALTDCGMWGHPCRNPRVVARRFSPPHRQLFRVH